MPDQEQDNVRQPFHREGDAFVFDVPPTPTEIARQRREDEQHEFARSQVKTNKKLALFTGALVFATFCTIGVGVWQARISQEASRAAKSAAETASATLAAMQTSQVSSDLQFGTQLEELKASIGQASRLAKAAEEGNKNAMEENRPWFKLAINVVDFEVGKIAKAGFMFTNSGKRPGFVLFADLASHTYDSFPTNPDYVRKPQIVSNGFVVPGASAGNLTPILEVPLSQEALDALNSGNIKYYVYARVEYKDVRTNQRHFAHACLQYIASVSLPSRPGVFGNCNGYNEGN